MAYADGELDLVARAEIESAMAREPEIAEAVERHRALAARVQSAYVGVLDEPVPERIAGLVAEPVSAAVADFASQRAARETRKTTDGWRLPQWAALAASVTIGFFVGVLLMRGPAAAYEETDNGLVARGELDEALTSQLASAEGEADVRVGLSFRDGEGDY